MKLTVIFFGMLAILQPLQAQGSPPCKVDVRTPQSGDTVEPEIQVQGTAMVPPGSYLWVLTHRKGIAQWWPQGGGAALIENENFDVFTTLGQDRDSGRSFEVAAIVVDSAGNAQLEKWVSDSDARKNWDIGLKLPSPATGCEAQIRTIVVKRK
jgi:hypothetical protein